jgi:lipopolysaccharide/colanic/teichoic acid biosynthesis glycosyltransferase
MFAAAVVLALLPAIAIVFALIAAAIVLDSPGPVLYRARRIGMHGKPFVMLKFRKMRADSAGPALTTIDDDRFTPIGRFLAITRLDELPQIWNVLRGEMRLVGPRPEVEEFVALYPDEYEEILRVKPGVTGLAQLRFSGESRLLAQLAADEVVDHYGRSLLPAKIALDRRYIASRSALLDLRIIALTTLLPVRALVRVAWTYRAGLTLGRLAGAALAVALFVAFTVQVGV